MNSILITLVVFLCCFAGIQIGDLLRGKTPEHHLGEDSRETRQRHFESIQRTFNQSHLFAKPVKPKPHRARNVVIPAGIAGIQITGM